MPNIEPILFNTDMVRAILENRKTVTRRVVKPQPGNDRLEYCFAGGSKADIGKWHGEGRKWNPPCHAEDILYVRETWAPLYPDETSAEVVAYLYKADRERFGEEHRKKYDAQYLNGEDYQWEGRWHPSIHMPREAARLFLRVTDVRVERLQDITDDEILAEGIVSKRPDWLRIDFVDEWNANIKVANLALYGWNANPWVL